MFCSQCGSDNAGIKCSLCEKILCNQCAMSGKNISSKYKNDMFCRTCFEETLQYASAVKAHNKELGKAVGKSFFTAVWEIVKAAFKFGAGF